MNTIRVTKDFTFEMAHALDFHNGKCKNIHGHSYKLQVTVIGQPQKKDASDKGMVIDFYELKVLVNESIVDRLDHALLLQKDSKYNQNENHTKLVLVDYQPTCENMAIDFAETIKPLLPNTVKLHSLKLKETATSCAEWFASDN